ncbi:type III restriction-modification system endonuclease [Senegalia massiliensis]|uniref:type III restriction-modification system endonuclease n=1 Tax=Senegalia massiliensis TaxID=1720316 RepID=UPI00102F607E|nr:type III restriction-modification system endonuclease [Senegalia massiliensis]
MNIKLKILPHQTEALNAVTKVLKDVRITSNNPIYQNPIIDINDDKISYNVEEIWEGEAEYRDKENDIIKKLPSISKEMRKRENENVLGIDAKLETGTGKTYIYTRLMHELNELYGFNKFLIFVPSSPIKEGTKSFIESEYSKRHFNDLYPGKDIKLEVLNAQKRSRAGRKMFPTAISSFVRGTRLERNKINTLLMTDKMFISKTTMEKDDYDQTLFGEFTQPYKALEETRPIVIIDEPHRFKKQNVAYKRIIEKLNPQMVIRFGATFPELPKKKGKDYNNLVYDLGAVDAFNENLVKGVEVQTLKPELEDDNKIKILDISLNPKKCRIRNEKTKKTFEMVKSDNLSMIDDSFKGIEIEEIQKIEGKKSITLSNGHILGEGDILFSSVYGQTFQDLMVKRSLDNHFAQEKENFLTVRKIKTLTLYFIDSIYSYRGEENDGNLKLSFEEQLSNKIKKEINKINETKNPNTRLLEYREYLEASLNDIKKTNGGYFSEDNSTKDEDIENEVNKILRDKNSLLSFKDENDNWNTMRFIFSKWTLREGWDNPNVFQIVKLRSSGSEISKLQEVGRGLRLPVDELGNRLSEEQFYLRYLIDFTEKDFAERLVKEINKDADVSKNIKGLLSKVSKSRRITEEELFIDLLQKGYVDIDKNIKEDKYNELISEYPEFNKGLYQDKVRNVNKDKKSKVKIRPKRFDEIKELWESINQKYYLKLDEINREELFKVALNIFKSNIYKQESILIESKRTKALDTHIEIRENIEDVYLVENIIPYNEFLKNIYKNTGLSINIIHKALIKFNQENKIPKDFFNMNTLKNFIVKFENWLEDSFVKRFSYKKLGIRPKETALTDINGDMKESIVQGNIGIMKDSKSLVPEKFLFDSFVYDSDKERETIRKSIIDEIVVFGKIPRNSIRVPLYFGGTTSPDFMYVLKKQSGEYIVNFIVETKGVDKEKDKRGREDLKIESARVFFNTMKEDGLDIVFEEQLNKDDIVNMIKKLV